MTSIYDDSYDGSYDSARRTFNVPRAEFVAMDHEWIPDCCPELIAAVEYIAGRDDIETVTIETFGR